MRERRITDGLAGGAFPLMATPRLAFDVLVATSRSIVIPDPVKLAAAVPAGSVDVELTSTLRTVELPPRLKTERQASPAVEVPIWWKVESSIVAAPKS